MPCDSSVSQTVLMNVTAGSLPEGFCPNSMQELFDAMVARMIVTPNQAFTSFAAGSVEPTSNVGPWLKDCETWFVFDPSTGSYIPMRDKGFDNMQYFVSSGTFIVPEFIYKLKITAFGGGGGGHASATAAGAGGGGGGAGLVIVDVVPGQSIPFVVGSGGAGGTPGAAGGNTTILTFSANGGAGASTVISGGMGGNATGFTVNLTGQAGSAGTGSSAELKEGGDAAMWGGKGGVIRENASPTGRDGTAPGGGGAGGGNGASTVIGNGASGAILIEF